MTYRICQHLSGIFLAVSSVALLQSLPDWAGDRSSLGWSFLALNATQDSMYLTRPGPRPSMIWSRAEYVESVNNQHSAMALYELDCANGKYRQLQIMSYPEPNLSGRPTTQDLAEPWSYPGPGTIGESIFRRGCGVPD